MLYTKKQYLFQVFADSFSVHTFKIKIVSRNSLL